MTILDTERKLARPLACVAREICNADKPKPSAAFDGDAWDLLVTWCDIERGDPAAIGAKGSIAEQKRYEKLAAAALSELRSLGYINDIGLEAIKQEERQ